MRLLKIVHTKVLMSLKHKPLKLYIKFKISALEDPSLVFFLLHKLTEFPVICPRQLLQIFCSSSSFEPNKEGPSLPQSYWTNCFWYHARMLLVFLATWTHCWLIFRQLLHFSYIFIQFCIYTPGSFPPDSFPGTLSPTSSAAWGCCVPSAGCSC